MRFTGVKIRQFGKLKEKEISFAPGINVIYGENESGKSTLHAFLRAMLFGMKRGRGRASRQDMFSRCEPWENPGNYGGILRFESGGKEFRLTRRFARNDQREELVCETDGERLDPEKGDLEILFGEVSQTVFDNTVSVGQLKYRTEEGLSQALQNYMANYRESGDGMLDVKRALDILKKRRREEEEKKRQEQQGLIRRQRELEDQIAYREEEISRLMEQECQEKERLCALEAEPAGRRQNGREGEENREEAEPSFGKKGWLYGAVPGILLLLFFFFFLPLPVWMKAVSLLAVLFLGAAGGGLIYRKKKKEEAERLRRGRAKRAEEARQREEEMERKTRRARLEGSLQKIGETLEEKRTERENLQADYEECLEKRNQISEQDQVLEGIRLAHGRIEKLAAEHQNRYGGRLQKRISEIMGELTGGKYGTVVLEEGFCPVLHTGDYSLTLDQVSQGTAEQLYFALRMAAGEILCEEELPLILDEMFAMYDQKRLEAALRWLAEHKKQVILFTCQTREEETLRRLGIAYHRVYL